MKTTLLITRSLQIAILALTCSQANQALAQTIYIKGNNTTSLSSDGSYTTPGVPGESNPIVYESTSGSSVATLGAGVSVRGIRYESSAIATSITSNSSNALTLGSDGLIKDTNSLTRISSQISLNATQTWNLNAGTTTNNGTRLSGSITTGSHTLLIQGNGALDLQGSSTLGSLVTINNSLVNVAGNSVVTLGGTNGFDTLVITSGRVIGLTFGNFGSASSFGDGGTSAVITLGGSTTNGTFEYSGTSTSSNRTFSRVANGNATAGTNNGVIDVSTAGQTLTLTGNNSLSSAPSTFTDGGWSLGGNGNLIVSAGILNNTGNGSTAVNKFGTGSVTLSGNNTYRGPTTITAGTLIINGATTTNSTVTVNTGGTLAGNGTLGGIVNVMSGGILSPGNSPGLQNMGTLALNNGGNLNWQIFDATGPAGTGFDSINLSGTLNLAALTGDTDFQINLWSLSGVGPDVDGNATNFNNALSQSWTLVSTGSAITEFDATEFTINVGANAGTSGFSNPLGEGSFSVALSADNTDLMLVYTAIPEPATWAILALGALTLFVTRFRKTSRA